MTFEKHFRAIFNIYAHLQSTWLPILYTHVHGEQFTPSRYKEIIMVQLKPSAGLKGKPHQHALIFMPFYIQKSKAWVPGPRSYFGIYPNFRKLSTHPKKGNHIRTNQIYKQYS